MVRAGRVAGSGWQGCECGVGGVADVDGLEDVVHGGDEAHSAAAFLWPGTAAAISVLSCDVAVCRA